MYDPNRNHQSRSPAIFCRERDRGRPSRLTPAGCLVSLCSLDRPLSLATKGASAKCAPIHASARVLWSSSPPPLLSSLPDMQPVCRRVGQCPPPPMGPSCQEGGIIPPLTAPTPRSARRDGALSLPRLPGAPQEGVGPILPATGRAAGTSEH